MLENDISALCERDSVNLDELETDIWRREHQLRALRAAGRFTASGQGLILLLAVTLSAATGISAASKIAKPMAPLVENSLAPSTLLLGSHR
jgi:hypothetical protein